MDKYHWRNLLNIMRIFRPLLTTINTSSSWSTMHGTSRVMPQHTRLMKRVGLMMISPSSSAPSMHHVQFKDRECRAGTILYSTLKDTMVIRWQPQEVMYQELCITIQPRLSKPFRKVHNHQEALHSHQWSPKQLQSKQTLEDSSQVSKSKANHQSLSSKESWLKDSEKHLSLVELMV